MANSTDSTQVTGVCQLVLTKKQPAKEHPRNGLLQGFSNRLLDARSKSNHTSDKKLDELQQKQNSKSNSQLRKQQRKSKQVQSFAYPVESDGYYGDGQSEPEDKESYSSEDELPCEDEDALEESWWSDDDDQNLFSSGGRRDQKKA
ncbi:hypothetical protein F4813DRAFT_399321 [Daldinia decipiens]|uniref:uncharacterized protein n=1 Tax=Daldinia decipiens TaxID=326647 RepID=UPI0020C3781C|nr:uncharacterized protein F4813DRAFT_399321 [Daldinia decipiens]KAI1661351.1 hypothetical protein F4813DRAFT_399321 [Daldinia decipiens]